MTVTKWQIDANPTKLSRDVLVEANSTNILKNKASPGIEQNDVDIFVKANSNTDDKLRKNCQKISTPFPSWMDPPPIIGTVILSTVVILFFALIILLITEFLIEKNKNKINKHQNVSRVVPIIPTPYGVKSDSPPKYEEVVDPPPPQHKSSFPVLFDHFSSCCA